MRPFAAIALIFTLVFPSLLFGADQVGANQAALVGFSPRAGQSEREWEAKFRAIPDAANLREYMRRLSARPHHVGSPYDKDNAEWILAHFKEWGLDAHVERFDVLFPTPKVRVLEMLAPTKFTAKLEEPALAVDPTSNQKSEQLPTYNAYCAWDGEEPMLLGSTEWVETHADELREHAAVYINTDGNDRGILNMNGSHSLEQFINGVARDIEDPETKMTAWQRAQLSAIAEAKSVDDKKELRQRADLRIGALGSGTDFTGFIDHLGIATLDLGYGGEDEQGIYHSIYDDFYWYTHFSDTDFVYGRALAQTVGTSVMRLADAEVLPFDFVNLADTVERYTKNLEKLLADKQEEIRERNQELDEGMFKATFDPKRPTVPPAREDVPPHLNFAPMQNAVDSLTRSAKHYQQALSQRQASLGDDAIAARLGALNRELMESEQRLTNADGLPRRPWYKHLLYAPGVYTGYGVKTVPGVREGIEQKRYAEAEQEIVRVSKALEDESALIESAAGELESLGR
jgi:N-acetylated-alpha-linked acidic dipeptidase